MLRLRLLSAAAAIPVLLVLTLVGGVPFAVALAVALAAGALELCAAAGIAPRRPEALVTAALAAAFVPASYANRDLEAGLIVAALAAPMLAALFRAETEPPPDDGSGRVTLPLWLVLPLAALYLGWLGHYLLLVRRFPQGDRWFLLLLLGTFATDTGAYATGKLLGRHQLAPRVSPAKTVEGAIGGLVWAVIATVALDLLLGLPRRLPAVVLLGVALAAAAELGDLAESLIKRRLGVKDMGRIVPGHGGIVDRLDSLLFVGPVVYFIVRWVILR